MSIFAEIDAVINGLEKLIFLIEKIDPNAANNPLVQDLQKVLSMLKGLGL